MCSKSSFNNQPHVYQFSFAYDVLGNRAPTQEEQEKGVTNVLTKVDVFEISVVTVPANQNAVATEVKSGRRNNKSDEATIKEIIKLAQSLLETKEESEDKPAEDEAKSAEPTVETNAAAEESKTAENAKRAEDLLAKINEMKEG